MMTEPFVRDEKEPIVWIAPWINGDKKIIAGFTTKEGGVSLPPYDSNNLGFHVEDNPTHVLNNRQLLANAISVPLDHWVLAEQVHGNKVHIAEQRDKGKGSHSMETAIPDADGLVSMENEMVCAALFADCVPLFFADRKKGIVAISHAGWKGTVNKIAQKTTQAMIQLSADPSDIEVVIGPSICPSCYEVNDHVIQHIEPAHQNCYDGWDGQYQLDLKQLNKQLLIEAGVLPAHIYTTSYCTSHDSLFYSHRRDKHPTGRMIGFIGLA
ncbi:peptidoglycan editing factor PgeF [Gracilibacillus caseinilyticus]|uniref:Purine nucleoside phosphorylase n=1 Tax=Gracilibacillus caseinilyticus TaxID=2932256 RepID=A0ABY4EU56_9BACI|nr:peptidoglycan editing factor PgeF [Gracilibacillus caseinilyticus]UOQ47948.1 peptidoglycan editing factor PgeF [Gracilibacillus caseinilyticus]